MPVQIKCGNIEKLMEKFMREALREAEMAAAEGEIPVGAVIVRDEEIISSAHNMVESLGDLTAHAEIIAIRNAAKKLGGWKLPGCSMYVTLEPCSMCAGAIVLARISELVIGTPDQKSGACGSVFNITQDERLNHMVSVRTGLLQEECSGLLKSFFRRRREENRRNKINRRENQQ